MPRPRDLFDEIVKMFWEDCECQGDAPPILRAFIEWMEVRRKGGSITDLRLVRNQGAWKTLNEVMNGDSNGSES